MSWNRIKAKDGGPKQYYLATLHAHSHLQKHSPEATAVLIQEAWDRQERAENCRKLRHMQSQNFVERLFEGLATFACNRVAELQRLFARRDRVACQQAARERFTTDSFAIDRVVTIDRFAPAEA